MVKIPADRSIKMLHLSYLSALIHRRKFCVFKSTTKLSRRAKIYNLTGDNASIIIGSNSHIEGELMTLPLASGISIGDWSYISVGTRVWCRSSISIGNRVLVAHNVDIFDSLTHPINAEQRHLHFMATITTGHPDWVELDARPIVIQDDCWVGAGAAIMRGVTIGTGAIIAARSVVTKNVPPHCIAAGNPAQIIRIIK